MSIQDANQSYSPHLPYGCMLFRYSPTHQILYGVANERILSGDFAFTKIRFLPII